MGQSCLAPKTGRLSNADAAGWIAGQWHHLKRMVKRVAGPYILNIIPRFGCYVALITPGGDDDFEPGSTCAFTRQRRRNCLPN
jgi:hypothetical protein